MEPPKRPSFFARITGLLSLLTFFALAGAGASLAETARKNAGVAGARGRAPATLAARTDALAEALAARLMRVREFAYLREQAEKLGVRVWLFGGTAAAYGHYVNWDLQREGGDKRFQKERFDYDYTNIFRSTQDLDIVVDGDPRKAQVLQLALENEFPYLMGGKGAGWEVRPLRQAMGSKQALLDNPDFLNQHTDSNSTGMIEVSRPPKGEPVVRDLRDWKARTPYFLRDLRDGKLHFYESAKHAKTSRAREGLNPPIFSAVRALTKAFQYELELRPEDWKAIRRIVKDFDPERDLETPYATRWLIKNAKKLIQNAVNIEFAVDKLDELGLRKKLARIDREAARGPFGPEDTLAWWMGRQPLETRKLGRKIEGAPNRTAAEVFEKKGWAKPGDALVVAHETQGFLAYESITRAHTGEPNVLISRKGAAGEMAVFGNGFYTRVGRAGARDTGLTIRFALDPAAREGSDFHLAHEDFVIVTNKAALKVIPESLNFTPAQYFGMLADGDAVDPTNLALLEKFKRRVGGLLQSEPAEAEEVVRIIRERLRRSPPPDWEFLHEWLSTPAAARYPELLGEILDSPAFTALQERLPRVNPQWVKFMSEEFLNAVYAHPELKPRFEGLLSRWADSGHGYPFLAKEVLPHEWAASNPKLESWVGSMLHKLRGHEEIDERKILAALSEVVASNPRLSPAAVIRLTDDLGWRLLKGRMNEPDQALRFILGPKGNDLKSFDERERAQAAFKRALIRRMGDWKPAAKAPVSEATLEFLERTARTIESSRQHQFVDSVLLSPLFAQEPRRDEWVRLLVKRKDTTTETIAGLLSQPEVFERPGWMEYVEMVVGRERNGWGDDKVIADFMARPEVLAQPDWERLMKKLFSSGGDPNAMDKAYGTLARVEVMKHPAWARVMKKYIQDRGAISFVSDTLTAPEAMAHAEWSEVVDAVFSGFRSGDKYFVQKLLAHPEVRKSPKWPEWVDKVVRSTRNTLDQPYGVGHYEREDARETRAALLKIGVDCKARFGKLASHERTRR